MIQRLYRPNAIGYAKLFKCTHDAVIRVFDGIPTNSTISFILFTLSRDLVAKNRLFANLAIATDDVLISG
jgi:hypothetical protein